jgi:hypothetical protein
MRLFDFDLILNRRFLYNDCLRTLLVFNLLNLVKMRALNFNIFDLEVTELVVVIWLLLVR